MPTTHAEALADPIPLSEIKEWLGHLEIRPWFADATSRQRIEVAVNAAKCERLDAAQYQPLTDAEWAALNTPTPEGEERLPW